MAQGTISMRTFKLNNGQVIPAIGLGTFQGVLRERTAPADEKILRESIVFALKIGYRLIDTAPAYGVEAVVGDAIRESGVPRSNITVISKLSSRKHHVPKQGLLESLEALGLDYVDILLMHWPNAISLDGQPFRFDESPTFVETWLEMEKLVGPQCKAIGVSNFTQKTLDILLESAQVVPVVNQIELHVLNPHLKLVPYCRSKGIHVMSWSTLGGVIDGGVSRNEILTNDLFVNMGQARGHSAATISFSWAVQRGISVIPKSITKSRIEQNMKLITLTDEEMNKLNKAYESVGMVRISDSIQMMRSIIEGKPALMGWTNVDFGFEDENGNWLT